MSPTAPAPLCLTEIALQENETSKTLRNARLCCLRVRRTLGRRDPAESTVPVKGVFYVRKYVQQMSRSVEDV